jgi:DhnA family fructose-bisphosphate aldolase class Ia
MHPKTHRMRRIFRPDGRTLVVAMDHAGFMGPVPGLIDPVATVSAVVAGGADAVMTTLGTAKRIARALDGRGLILSVDIMAPDPVAVVETAIALGADSLKTLAYWGGEDPDGTACSARSGDCPSKPRSSPSASPRRTSTRRRTSRPRRASVPNVVLTT